MRYCPHCRKPSVKESGSCPHCGKDLDAAPSSRTAGGSGAYEDMGSTEAVGVEVDSRYSPTSPPAGSRPSSSSLSPSPSSPSLTPVEEMPSTPPLELTPTVPPASLIPSVEPKDEGSGLELDTSDYMPPGSVHPSGVPRPSSVPKRGGVPLIPSFSEEETIDFDLEDLEAAAGYGPPPKNIFAAVPYAFMARRRSAELQEKARGYETGLEHAKSELVDELARLGERARVAGYQSKGVSALLKAVDVADRSAESAKDAVASERRRHEQRLEEIDRQLEELRVNMEKPRLKESKLASELAEHEEKRRQIEMRLKRVEIEIRNSEELIARADQAPAEGAAPQDRATLVEKAREAEQRLPGLQADRQRLRSENAVLDDPITDLRNELAKTRDEVDRLKAARVETVKKRDEEDQLHASNKDSISSQSEQAKKEAQTKLGEIGRAVRYDRNAPSWAKELFPSIDERTLAFTRLWEDHQKLLQASEIYDHAAVKRGFIVLFGGAGLAVAVLVALIVVVSSLS